MCQIVHINSSWQRGSLGSHIHIIHAYFGVIVTRLLYHYRGPTCRRFPHDVDAEIRGLIVYDYCLRPRGDGATFLA